MANEDKKDFNAMLHRATDMPRIQLVTDAATVQKYGGARMYFAPAADYDAVMKRVPFGKVLTVGKIREYFARKNGADFTDPITAGIFVSISAWASAQRADGRNALLAHAENGRRAERKISGRRGGPTCASGGGGAHRHPAGPHEYPLLCAGL